MVIPKNKYEKEIFSFSLEVYKKALRNLMIAYCQAVSPSIPIDWDLVEANIQLYLKRARLEIEKEAGNGKR